MKSLVLLVFVFAGCASVSPKCSRACYTTLGSKSSVSCTIRKMVCSESKLPHLNKWNG
jgi:hypothetical protein